MQYKVFVFNPVQENTYLIWDEATKDAAIIDAGMWRDLEWQIIADCIRANGFNLCYALQTHMHFDHIFGLGYIHEHFNIGPVCHADEVHVYNSQPQLTRSFGLQLPEPLPPVQKVLNDDDSIRIGETELSVIHTPGHTPGGICFYDKKDGLLFCGDTLFQASIGRTDLPGGSYDAIVSSIRNRLFTLPDETKVFPGHGPSTTIGWEKQNNAYV